MNIRCTFTVEGIVQGVGYREIVRAAAHELDLTGYVQNIRGGTVKVVCEGDRRTIKTFLKRIRIKDDWISVDGVDEKYSKPTGEFPRFWIEVGQSVSDGDLEIMERLDRGRREMQMMNANLSGKQDKMIEKQGETTDVTKTMDSHISHMDTNMGTRFDRFDKKYGEFGKTLKCVRRHTKTMASDIKTIRKEATRGRKKPVAG